jgi:hypothetical protein
MRGKRGGGELDAAQAVLDAREANLGLGHVEEEEEELNENGLTHDEEELVKSIKFGVGNGVDRTTAIIHRLDEEDELLAEKKIREEAEALILKNRQIHEDTKGKSNVPVFKVKRKKRKETDDDGAKRAKTADPGGKGPAVAAPVASDEKEIHTSDASGGPLSGLLGYGSDSDSN